MDVLEVKIKDDIKKNEWLKMRKNSQGEEASKYEELNYMRLFELFI